MFQAVCTYTWFLRLCEGEGIIDVNEKYRYCLVLVLVACAKCVVIGGYEESRVSMLLVSL